MFGAKLGVGRIIAGAPQVVLDPKLPHAPKVPVKYSDITSIIAEAPRETKIDIWYGAESFSDIFNMAHLKPQENLCINAVPGSMHNVLQTFKRRGEMAAFLEYAAVATPFSTRTVEIPASAGSLVIKAGRLFYIRREFESVIDTLAPIADDIDLSAVHCVIADSYFRLGNYEGARAYYERAAAVTHENYDANYNLGLCLEKLKKDRAAVRAFAKALEFVPTKDGFRYAKLAAAQYRLGALDDAFKNYTIAIKTGDYPSRCHYDLGRIMMARNRPKEALAHFEQHHAAVPDFAPTRKLIAGLKHRLAKTGVRALACAATAAIINIASFESSSLVFVGW
jgi:tetratricopeptide (TPR) repeat protein